MIAIAVDDNLIALELMTLQLERTKTFREIKVFSTPGEAIAWSLKNQADVAFLDIIMNEMSGIDLAQELRAINPDIKIIFCSTSEDFAMDAFRIHADGYLTKPVTESAILEELSHMHLKDDDKKQETDKLYAQCFGNFEVYYNDTPLHFKYQKSKELLAYLVHRNGATCSNRELAAVLYEDREDSDSLQSQIRTLIASLNKTLREVGQEDVLYKTRGAIAILPEKISCDYYDFLKGMEAARRKYSSEYMAQYPWADVTAAYLERKKF